MKVVMIHVGNEVPHPDPAKPETYLKRRDLISGEERFYARHDIVNSDAQMHALMKAGVDIRYGHFSARKSITQIWKAGRQMRKLAMNFDADLVHVMWGSTSAFVTVLFSPKPVIISYCGSDLLGGYNHAGIKETKNSISVLLSQLAAFGARRIIVKSEKLKLALWKTNMGKASIVPNGVDLKLFHPEDQGKARETLGWKPHIPIVLFFCGMGQTVKNKPLAEATFGLIRQKFPDAQLKIVSGVPHHQLVNFYNAADLMLLTSLHEGSNNSLKEAIACNLPVVSVDCGDVRERLKNVSPSFVADSYDAATLADAAIAIIDSRLRSNGSVSASQVSEEAITRKVIAVYEEALNS